LIEVLLGLGFVGDFHFVQRGHFDLLLKSTTTLSQTGWGFRLVGGWVGFL